MRLTLQCLGAALLGAALVALVPQAAVAQTAADSAAIRAAAGDYIHGWYTGDAARMQRALHPDLAKRIVETDASGRSTLGHMGAEQLVAGTRNGGGNRTPKNLQRADIRILDAFGNAASVRVDAASWVDYLHLAKFDGQWVIVNVLWEMRPRS